MATKTPRSIWILLIGVLAFVAVGCGDDGADEAAEPLDEDEFIEQFDEVCIETDEALDDLPEPENYNDLVELSEEAIEIATEGLDALREITPPEDLAGDVDDLLDLIEARTDLFEDLRDAAENTDDGEINNVLASGMDLEEEVNEIAQDLDLECFAD